MLAATEPVIVAAPRERRWRPVHGVLLLDKPIGLSSQTALQRARRLLRAEKAGHTGTLDPLATGLLPLCFGAATKFSQAVLDADKGYRATVQFGVATDSGDAEGQVVSQVDAGAAQVPRDVLRRALERLTGDIDQVPPMHSALKRDGRPLYAYARAGVALDLPPRRVRIHALDIADPQDQEVSDRWTLDVHCSKGTYVRSLARDLGLAIGCGAHLAGLRRTAAAPFSLADAVTLEALEALDDDERAACLLPVEAPIAAWPSVRLPQAEAQRFAQGLRRRLAHPDTAQVRVYGPRDREFLGVGRVLAGELVPTRLLSPDEVEYALAAAA
ncbi:MAG: tRNA pseudouridine(55) synthase TruB [Ideonella sp.]|jgi:tRNA pseudouridine55 synthase|nr:tRNA pseudouridine(55) synthase TruB [Ideonella sp.]